MDGCKLPYNGDEDKKNGVGSILDLEMKEKVVDVTRHNYRLIMVIRLVIHGSIQNV